MKLTVEPEIVHTALLDASIVSVTGSFDVAWAVTWYVGPPTVAGFGAVEVNAIVCGFRAAYATEVPTPSTESATMATTTARNIGLPRQR
jgi:hypothetical protein